MRRYLTVVVVGLGAATGPLDTAVNIGFPAITDAFAVPIVDIQWVIICYVLTYASLLLNFGRLADVVGHRRVFAAGLALSAVALVLCAVPTSFAWLLVFRGLQGLGTALVLAAGPALVTLSFSDSERARALGAYTMVLTAGMAAGPLIGGVVVEHWGWPAVFLFRVPLAVIALAALWLVVEQPVAVDSGQRYDLLGAAALSATLVLALLGMNRLGTLGPFAPSTVVLVLAAALAVTAFLRVERGSPAPVIDLRLFARRPFLVANVAHALAQLAGFTVMLLGPYFLVRYTAGDVARAGLLLALSPVAGAAAAAATGPVLARVDGWRLSRWALVVCGLGLAGIAAWTPASPLALIAATLVVQGVGLGVFQVANSDYVMGSVARAQHGVAGALTMLTRTIGVVGGATLGAVAFTLLGGTYSSTEAGLSGEFVRAYRYIFLGAGAIALAAAALMLRPGGVSRRRG